MKIEMSHEIKSNDQLAGQQINDTNQLQTNIAQPAKQHDSETTYHRNIYKLNNPWLSQLYILIYQMASNVIRLAMRVYQPTIKNYQTKENTNSIRIYSPLFLYICSLSKTWDPEDVHCVWNYSVRILWLLEIRWPLIRYSWRSWVPCSIELSRSLAQGILRFVSSGLWAVCQGKQEKM